MFRLRHVVIMMTHAFLVGSLLIAVLVLGLTTWPWVVGAIVLGFALAWPVGLLVTGAIRKRYPTLHTSSPAPEDQTLGERLQTEFTEPEATLASPHAGVVRPDVLVPPPPPERPAQEAPR